MCLSIRRETFLLSSIIQNFTVKLIEKETIIYASSYNTKVSQWMVLICCFVELPRLALKV